jgi:pimeloyl-ACP methyl ester carboxylesterase
VSAVMPAYDGPTLFCSCSLRVPVPFHLPSIPSQARYLTLHRATKPSNAVVPLGTMEDAIAMGRMTRAVCWNPCLQRSWPAFGATDFRDDIAQVTIPALILHGDGDGTVPFEDSGQRTHAAISGSQLHLIADAPHGCNVSHAAEWNATLLDFLGD